MCVCDILIVHFVEVCAAADEQLSRQISKEQLSHRLCQGVVLGKETKFNWPGPERKRNTIFSKTYCLLCVHQIVFVITQMDAVTYVYK